MIKIFQAWYNRHKLLFRILAGIVVLYALAGFSAAPFAVRHLLENNLSEALHRDVRMTTVRTNPFTFSLRLIGLTIGDRDLDAAFIQVDNLYINADPLISLFKWGVAIRSVIIDTPRIRIVRTGDFRFNFSDLSDPSPENHPKNTEPESKSVRLLMDELRLVAGEIRFVDNSRNGPFETTVTGLAATVNELDTRPEADALHYALSGTTEADEHLEVHGQSHLRPFSIEAQATFKNLAPAKYAPYYKSFINAKVAAGRIDLQTALQWGDRTRAFSGLKIAVGDLVIKDYEDDKGLLLLPRFVVEGASVDLMNQDIRLGRIRSQDARLFVRRNANGQMNLLTAFAPRWTVAPASRTAAANNTPASRESSWKVVVPELLLKDYAVDFEDFQPPSPARMHLQHIAVTAENLSTEKQTQGKVDLKLDWADQGTLSARGDIGLVPPQAALDVTAANLDIRPLQPYIQEFAQLLLTKGEFSSRGKMQWMPGEGHMDLRFTGQASLDRFEALDAEKATLFSKWNSLYMTGIHFGTAPLRARVEKVALTDFIKRLTINADGTANIETILTRHRTAEKKRKHADTAAFKGEEDAGSAGGSAAISIKTITLQGGKVDFIDNYVKPQVHLAMRDLGGTISGLDNIKENSADVRLIGKVGGNVPLEIKGRINPLIEKPFIDVSLNFPGFDLSQFTPYSGKYLGYTMEKGQLAFSLAYRVADNKLSGQNKIQLNQFTFGSPVASPQATKLPVKLAVALLKDREGNIDLDLPVRGDLNDPQFSLGGLILKMFVNLITQIVTSPFKMLGAVFGGGEELAYLEFDPGQSAISPDKIEKLNTLEEILYERPGLSLEIQGQVDPQQDAEGLRRMRFEEQLKADKLKALVAAGRNAMPLDRIEISPQERGTMIQKAYDRADFPKPRDDKGRLKKIPPPEMEKLLFTSIDVGADDLRQLAHERASAAKDFLIGKGRIESGRLFVVEPRIPADTAGNDAKSQVQFNLK